MVSGSPYQGYLYAYPHKTAYRPLRPPVPLREAWADEPKDGLFLYVHVPYCEMRCGFCNLFTTTRSSDDLHRRWLDGLARQVEAVAGALGPARFAQGAVGGGTPTILAPDTLARMLDTVERGLGVDLRGVPTSIETSPATARAERLAVLRERGAVRASLGVQSFVEAEAHAVGRPQRTAEVEAALDAIRAARFPVLNVDLMYGLPGQTAATFRASLDRALAWAPEELFLYPLYVRPLTGLGRTGRSWDDQRLDLYRAGRDHLRTGGYVQWSMRLFRRADAPRGPTRYRCQEDGMVGLGAGARSYTRALHWSSEWGVGRPRVQGILDGWIARTDHGTAEHGIRLSEDEQRRRYLVQSLLNVEGLSLAAYRARFGTDPLADCPELDGLVATGLVALADGVVVPTEAGLERSDAVGPRLVSDAVRAAMSEYELR